MRRFISLATAFVLVAVASPARAELAFFANGRSISVSNHRVDGDTLVLSLRGGGEVTCRISDIARITPDEVPYPEPVTLSPSRQADVAGSSDRRPYVELVDRISNEQGVDPRLVKAVIEVESNYRKDARSPKGAMGLMQLMPATARQYQVKDPYDAQSNLEGGVRHLRALLERFPVNLALAAYNAGESAVERFNGIPPYPETRSYVDRVLGLLAR